MSRLIGSRVISALLLLACLPFAAAQNKEPHPAEVLTDPTRPLLLQAEGSAGILPGLPAILERYIVSSILVRPDLKLAVINSQRVREGERVGNALVTSIERDRVMLNVNGELREFRVHQGSIKSRDGSDG